MLTVYKSTDYDSEASWISNNLIKRESARWIVPDLKTKEAFKKILHQKNKVLPENKVMRANEYWLEIFNAQSYGYEFVSANRMQIDAKSWLIKNHFEWSQKPGSHVYLIDFINSYLSLIIYDEKSEKLFSEWLYANTRSIADWGLWFFMAKSFWQEVVLENKTLLPHWCSGLVEASSHIENKYEEIIFTLGSQIKGVEADIILSLKKENNISCLLPEIRSKVSYETLLWPHQKLIESADKEVSASEDSKVAIEKIKKNNFHMFASQVGEVKHVVSKVRALLDEGVSPSDINILCSDLEFYWPLLSDYLEKEGVPIAKPVMSPLSSFGNINILMSRLRLFFYKESKEDIELNCYGSNEAIELPVADFQRLYDNYYDNRDFSKNQKVVEAVDRKKRDAYFQVSEVIEILIEAQRNESSVHIELVIQNIMSDFDLSYKMKSSEWLDYLESLVASIEIIIKKSDINGISIDNFLGSKYILQDHVFVLGFTENQMQSKKNNLISYSDVFKIYNDLGVVINLPEHSMELFEMDWLMTSQKSISAFRSEKNFNNEPLMPSLLELIGGGAESLTSPGHTRWCEVHKSHSGFDKEPVRLSISPEDVTLSATQIENYNNCPYIFMAKKLFKLSDLPSLDVDVDRMTNGLFIHELFEKIIVNQFSDKTSDEEIKNLVLKLISSLFVFEMKQKEFLVSSYVEVAKRFIAAESLLMQESPGRLISETELDIVGHWSVANKDFTKEAGSEDFKFYGRADRVDKDSNNNFLVIDYKSSPAGLTNYGSWIKNNKLQLALYGRALEKGLSEKQYASFAGALYYVAKDFSNNKGLIVEGLSPSFTFSRSNKISAESWESDFWPQIAEVFSGIVEKISAGNFEPAPIDKKICEACAWRSACRAKHL